MMWTIAKNICLMGVLCGLSACASTFSSYDSEFSCKNGDHGGCEHPMTAYRKALRDNAAVVEERGSEDISGTAPSTVDGKPGGTAGSYQGYKGAVYTELQALLEAPNTPLIVPAKTIRTLILPHTNSQLQSQRLYMSRFIFTVLEEARFVLGSTSLRPTNNPFLGGLMSSNQLKPQAGPESQAGKE